MASRQAPPVRPKGTPKTGGRKRGTPNKATLEIKAFARGLFARPKYQARLRRQWDDGTLEPELQKVLLYYAFGKPTTAIDLNVAGFDPLLYLAGRK